MDDSLNLVGHPANGPGPIKALSIALSVLRPLVSASQFDREYVCFVFHESPSGVTISVVLEQKHLTEDGRPMEKRIDEQLGKIKGKEVSI